MTGKQKEKEDDPNIMHTDRSRGHNPMVSLLHNLGKTIEHDGKLIHAQVAEESEQNTV